MGHVALSLQLQQRLESLDRALHRSALGLQALGLPRSALGPRSSAHEAVPLGLPRQSFKECGALRVLLRCALRRHRLSALALGLLV